MTVAILKRLIFANSTKPLWRRLESFGKQKRKNLKNKSKIFSFLQFLQSMVCLRERIPRLLSSKTWRLNALKLIFLIKRLPSWFVRLALTFNSLKVSPKRSAKELDGNFRFIAIT